MRNVKKIKVGDTVSHNLLGEGLVIRLQEGAVGSKGDSFCGVEFYRTPVSNPYGHISTSCIFWLWGSDLK
jgi:hypothetical protein